MYLFAEISKKGLLAPASQPTSATCKLCQAQAMCLRHTWLLHHLFPYKAHLMHLLVEQIGR